MPFLDRLRSCTHQRSRLTWLPVSVIALRCAVLAALQYRWIGEISMAERDRLKNGLDTSLRQVAREFNSDISSAVAALIPPDAPDGAAAPPEELFADAYVEWVESGRNENLFSRLALIEREETNGTATAALKLLNTNTRRYEAAAWPAQWLSIQEAIERPGHRPEGRPDGPGPGPGPGGPGGPPPFGFFGMFGSIENHPELVLIPRLARLGGGGPGGGPPGPRPPEREFLLAEVSLETVGKQMVPELITRHLGAQYDAKLVARADPAQVLFRTAPMETADATVSIFEIAPDALFRRFSRGGRGGGFDLRGEGARRTKGGRGGFFGFPGGPPPNDVGRGRWLLSVRNKAGSLDAIIARARWRNLGLSAAILALLIAAAAALIRYSRQAEKLGQLQMDFVASISHELRTPLTVIRMAAFNLKGRIAQNPEQVERYGTLIKQESERLTSIVEQVLRFASLESGKNTIAQTPVFVNDLLAHTIESSRPVIEHAHCELEQGIAANLPAVLGDSIALQHALQNLITNAVKYGTESSNWIGVFAEEKSDAATGAHYVEVRVADRGAGIPVEEQAHLFDPFFRGRRAMEDQIHGTGLGLNLVKKIIEAHGGKVAVKSAPGQGTEFAVRIPVAPPEYQDEFAHTFG